MGCPLEITHLFSLSETGLGFLASVTVRGDFSVVLNSLW